MLVIDSLILLALGVGIGSLGALIGVGGGFLIVPLLLIAYDFEPGMAAGTSLLAVFFNALSASLVYLKQKRVDVKIAAMFSLLTLPGSIIGASLTRYFDSNIFRLVFAAMLGVMSIYLIMRPIRGVRKPRAAGYVRRIVDSWGEEFIYSVPLLRGLLISLGVGFLSSIFGIGGGIIHVPSMIFLLGIPVHIATATSSIILAISSLVGSTTHASLGNVSLTFALPLGVGAVLGAQLGARVSYRIRGTTIQRILGIGVAAVALRLALHAM